MERSTHTVTWQPMKDDQAQEIAALNDKFNKEQREAAELEELGL